MNTGKMAQLAAFGTIALLSFLPTLLGGQFIWYPESGNWKDAANWRDEHGIEVEEPPGSGDSATINNGGTSQITDERHAAVIDIAYGAGYSGTLQVTGGHSTFGSINIGLGIGASGTVEVSGTSTKSTFGEMYIGFDEGGTGTVCQAGGTVETAFLDLAFVAASSGVTTGYYNLDAGVLKVTGSNGIWLADEGEGTISQTGGACEITYGLTIGWKGYHTNTSSYDAVGTYILEEGTVSVGSYCDVGGDCGGEGSMEISGGSATIGAGQYQGLQLNLNVGCYSFKWQMTPVNDVTGCGTLLISGGSLLAKGDCYVGGAYLRSAGNQRSGGTGTIDLQGDGSFTVGSETAPRDFVIGAFTYINLASEPVGTGDVLQEGGSLTVWGKTYVGGRPAIDQSKPIVGGVGAMTVTGGTASLKDDVCIGCYTGVPPAPEYGTGSFVLEGGTVPISGGCYVGGKDVDQAGIGSLTVTGGALTIGEDLSVGTTHKHIGQSLHGWGTLQVGDEEAEEETNATIHVGGQVVFGPRSSFHVVEPSTQPSRCTLKFNQAGSGLVIEAGADGSELDGLGKTELDFTHADDQSQVKTIEVAGVDPTFEYVTSQDFCADNFVIDKLSVGASSATGPVTLKLLDDEDNQPDEDEALYVNWLEIPAHGTFDLNGLNLYYLNGGDPKQFFMGDANLDGVVDFTDYQILESNFGQTTGMAWADADFDGDGDVDFTDYQILEANWGEGFRSGGRGDSAELPALPVLKDYDEDGDVDIDDLHILQQMQQS